MSQPSWLAILRQTLNQPQKANDVAPRVAVVGIGHELNGDDAAGLAVIRALLAHPDTDPTRLLLIDVGPAPENQTGALRAFRPHLVLLIDAAQMDAEPGSVRWLDWRDTTGISASTHTLPPYMLGQFLTADLGCEVALIGIQPQANQLDAPLSLPVTQAVEAVVEGLVAALITPPDSSA